MDQNLGAGDNSKNTPLKIITARKSTHTTFPEVKNKSEMMSSIIVNSTDNMQNGRTPVMV